MNKMPKFKLCSRSVEFSAPPLPIEENTPTFSQILFDFGIKEAVENLFKLNLPTIQQFSEMMDNAK